MNKKQKWICAALAAAMIGTGSAASAAGSVVWVLAGTAAQADGSATRIAVPDRRAATEETKQTPDAAQQEAPAPVAEETPAASETVTAVPEQTVDAPAEAEMVRPAAASEAATLETVPAEERSVPSHVMTDEESIRAASDEEMGVTVSAQEPAAGMVSAEDSAARDGGNAAQSEEDRMTALADAQRADMDQRKLAALQQQAEAAEAAAPAEPEETAEPSEAPEETPEPANEEESPVEDAARETTSDEQEAARPAENAARETDSGEQEEEPSEEEEEEGAGASISPENPMVVKADAMAYRGMTGDVDVRGRVDITHMQDRYQTEHVYGNSNTQQYIIPGKVRWTSPGNDMTAESGTYNGKTTIATFEGIKGWSQGKYYYEGESGVYNRTDNKAVVQKGYFTTKHAVAKVPDYRIEADSIDIYPNDHYTAHDVSLFLKNTRILTLSSYSGSLKDGTSLMTLIPSPTYDSDNGWGLKNRLTLPIGGAESDLYFDARLAWYTKEGFKPDVGLRWDTAPGTFRFRYAEEESSVNDDHVWVEKEPSFSFDSRHFYIPKTSFYVGARGEIGHWTEGRVSGSHKQWDVYLSHNPITLGPHLRFNWRLGYLRDYYGYNDTIRRNRYYSLGLSGTYGIVRSWINYTDNNQQGRTPYHFDTYDMDKPVNTGVRLQLTPLDAISVSYSIDTIDGELEHRYFTYYRDMHSFYGWIRYDNVEKETEFMIMPKDFTF